jgi:hypothetical protein
MFALIVVKSFTALTRPAPDVATAIVASAIVVAPFSKDELLKT